MLSVLALTKRAHNGDTQIERAQLKDLDWALANLDAAASMKTNPTKKSPQARWVYEAEAKGKKEYVRGPSLNVVLTAHVRRL